MDLIFHGPLGMELSLDKSAGRVVVKAAEDDSPALLVVGRALTAIAGVPVGAISGNKSWLAVVAKLQAPERPLSLTFEAPAAPPEEDPVVAEERARAEAVTDHARRDVSAPVSLAELAVRAARDACPQGKTARGRGAPRKRPRSRSPSPELTCNACGRTGTLKDGFDVGGSY